MLVMCEILSHCGQSETIFFKNQKLPEVFLFFNHTEDVYSKEKD